MWVMINNLTKECNCEIVNLSITRTDCMCTKLHINSVISCVRVIIIQLLQAIFFKDQTQFLFYFSAN